MESNTVGAVREPPTIEERVEKLEKANRRLTLVSFTLGAMLALVFVLAASKTAPPDKVGTPSGRAQVLDVIRAKKLEIVDEKGKVRLALAIEPLVLHVSGKDRVFDQKEAGLRMYDDKGKARISLTAGSKEWNWSWTEYHENGRPWAWPSMHGGGAHLWMNDEKGVNRAALTVTSDGPELSLQGKGGEVRARFAMHDGTPDLEFLDDYGKVIWQAPPTKSGLPPVAPK